MAQVDLILGAVFFEEVVPSKCEKKTTKEICKSKKNSHIKQNERKSNE